MRSGWLLIAVLGFGVSAEAHDFFSTKVTWSREISRIVIQRCASCHHEGGSAFSLRTFEEARPWAKAIKEEVLERRMPPWGAVKGFGEFQNDQALTQEEIELIGDWVEGGSPEGEPAYLPPKSKLPVWDPGAPPAGAGEQRFSGELAISRPGLLLGLGPESLAAGASLQVIASLPDGTVEPLLWIENYQPAAKRTYLFRQPLRLPAGSRITATTAEAQLRVYIK